MSRFQLSTLTRLALVTTSLTHLACSQDWDALEPRAIASNVLGETGGDAGQSGEGQPTPGGPLTVPGEMPNVNSELDASTPAPDSTAAPVAAAAPDSSVVDAGEASSTDAGPMLPPAVCGDGVLGEGEECDPGAGATADCTDLCKLPTCGDGIVNVMGEECDDGEATVECTAECKLPVCGDLVVDVGEECDDGEVTTECTAGCMFPVCGDGVVNVAGEECDEGGLTGDCTAECTSRCATGCRCEDHGPDHYHYCPMALHWDEARDFCEANDAYLARPNSVLEFGWIDSARQRFGIGQVFWVGLTDQALADRWVWSDGEVFSPASPDNLWVDLWRPGEPNGSGNCAVVGRNAEGKLGLDDTHCVSLNGVGRHFICESRMPQQP